MLLLVSLLLPEAIKFGLRAIRWGVDGDCFSQRLMLMIQKVI